MRDTGQVDAVRRAIEEGPPDQEPASRHEEAHLAAVAADLGLTPQKLQGLLPECWAEIKHDPELVRELARAKLQGRQRHRGQVPEGWTGVLDCPECGPVWIWPEAEGLDAVGCPWCHVRHRQGAVPEAAKVEG